MKIVIDMLLYEVVIKILLCDVVIDMLLYKVVIKILLCDVVIDMLLYKVVIKILLCDVVIDLQLFEQLHWRMLTKCKCLTRVKIINAQYFN